MPNELNNDGLNGKLRILNPNIAKMPKIDRNNEKLTTKIVRFFSLICLEKRIKYGRKKIDKKSPDANIISIKEELRLSAIKTPYK